jgi:hypothetical protein
MQVMPVEPAQIGRASSAFAGSAERQLSEPADFLDYIFHLPGCRDEHPVGSTLGKQLIRRETIDLRSQNPTFVRRQNRLSGWRIPVRDRVIRFHQGSCSEKVIFGATGKNLVLKMPVGGYEQVNTGLRVNDNSRRDIGDVFTLAASRILSVRKFYEAVTDL